MRGFFLLSMFFLTSCAKQTFIVNNGFEASTPPEHTSHFFFYGVGQEEVINLVESCPNGVGKIEAYQSPKNIAVWAGVSILTGGVGAWIFNPRAWKVYCM